MTKLSQGLINVSNQAKIIQYLISTIKPKNNCHDVTIYFRSKSYVSIVMVTNLRTMLSGFGVSLKGF